MTKIFCEEADGIFRLKVPFDNIYTSVFLIRTEQGNALVDCATTAEDVDEWIAPALRGLGLEWTDIKYLILTHSHGDHAGGKERVLYYNPSIKIVYAAAKMQLNEATMYEMKGHTLDCVGIFDKRTGTLIAGDGLQGAGVDKYRCFLESEEEYIKTIEKIEKDENVKNILFSHAYEPWNQDGVFGREEVLKILKICKQTR